MKTLLSAAIIAAMLPTAGFADSWCAEPGGAYAPRLEVDQAGYFVGNVRCEWANADKTLQTCDAAQMDAPHRVVMDVQGETLWYDFGQISAGPQPYRRCE